MQRPCRRKAVISSAAVAATILLSVFVGVGRGERSNDPERVQRWDFNTPGDTLGWTVGNNLAGLAVTEGCLKMHITGRDAYLFGPEVNVPLDGCMVRVRLRCEHNGNTQVYWKTAGEPAYSEQRQMSRSASGAGPNLADRPDHGFATLAFPIGQPTDVGHKLTGIRIDPFNGVNRGDVHNGRRLRSWHVGQRES